MAAQLRVLPVPKDLQRPMAKQAAQVKLVRLAARGAVPLALQVAMAALV